MTGVDYSPVRADARHDLTNEEAWTRLLRDGAGLADLSQEELQAVYQDIEAELRLRDEARSSLPDFDGTGGYEGTEA